jgi:hypothetical protein
MDMTKYGSAFVRPEDVQEGPRQERIVNVYMHEKYDCPVLEFEFGDKFTLNQTNTRIMNRTYGPESDNWLNHVVELSLGYYESEGEQKETVKLRPISQPVPSADNGGPAKPKRNELDDAIPF